MSYPGGGPEWAPTVIAPVAPPPRRPPWLPIVASAAAFLLLLSAIMSILFITRNIAYNQQKRTAAERQQTIDTLDADRRRLADELRKVEAERDAAKRDLGGAQGQADELTRQKQLISRCLNLLDEADAASRDGDKATSDAKTKEAEPICKEAFRYLS